MDRLRTVVTSSLGLPKLFFAYRDTVIHNKMTLVADPKNC